MLIDQPGLLMHTDMDLMGLRQPGLPTNTMVTRCSHCHFGLRLDRKTHYSTSISLIEPRTMFTYRDLWFLKKKKFRSSIFGRGNILRKTGRVVVAPTLLHSCVTCSDFTPQARDFVCLRLFTCSPVTSTKGS